MTASNESILGGVLNTGTMTIPIPARKVPQTGKVAALTGENSKHTGEEEDISTAELQHALFRALVPAATGIRAAS